jgi:hypothetical protein
MKSMLIVCILIDAIPSHARDIATAIAKMIALDGAQPVRRPMIIARELAIAHEKLAILVMAAITLVIPATKDTDREMLGGARAAVHQ